MAKNDNNVGNRIKSIRKEKGLTMEEMGNLIGGVKKSSVNNWEKGQNLPNSERLKRIAEIGGISVTRLLYGSPKEFIYNVLIKEMDSDTPLRKVVYQYIADKGVLNDTELQTKAISLITKHIDDIFLRLISLIGNTPNGSIEDIFNEPDMILRVATHFFSVKKYMKYPEYNEALKGILNQTSNLGTTLANGSIEEIEQRLLRKGMNKEEAHKEAINRYFYTEAYLTVTEAIKEIEKKLDNIYKEYEEQSRQ